VTLGDATITREIFGNVPHGVATAFYVITFAACGLAAWGFASRALQQRQGRSKRDPQQRRRGLAAVGSVVAYLTFHKQLRRDRYAGVAHMLMFYGFFILFIGTCLVAAEDYGQKLMMVEHLFFYGRFYLVASLIIDLGGVAMLVGLVMFIARRMRKRSGADDRGARRILDAWWVGSMSILLLLIGVSGFLLEGARIAQDMPGFEKWSVVGYATASAMRGLGIGGESAASVHRVFWIGHAALCVLFFALLPWKFFSHMVYGAVSWAKRTARPRAQLRLPSLDSAAPGAAAWREMIWRDLLQADACTTCGRCNSVCPAEAAGKPLHPREVVLGLRAAMSGSSVDEKSTGRGIPGSVTTLQAFIPDEAIWSCTTCGACSEACPVGIEVYDKIVEVRRGRVEQGVVPRVAEEVFESTAERANPYSKPASDRVLWATGLDVPVAKEREQVELLYWIGCAGSFDPDGQSVSKSMIKILNHLKVNYRVLGKKERCTGDPARRMGEEGLFQQLAKLNIETFNEHRVTRVLTHCPHCFNTFKNEYPELGSRFEVEHHSQFLARMVSEGRLKSGETASEATSGSKKVTFHDPCYLGRGNGETKAPRDVLFSLPQANVVEMERNGRESFCCGAGGGSTWLDSPGSTRVENLRAAEARATGAATIATGCPFCKSMMNAGVQATENGSTPTVQVKDLAELIVEAEGL